MEAPEKGTTAEACANYFQNLPSSKKASAHLCIDNDSIVQSVYDNNVAYAAPGANHNGIQLELAGYARQTRNEWLDDYGRALLENAANAAAQYCLKYDLPAKHLTNSELEAGNEGIIGHVQATAVFKKSTHTDPGEHFPWDYFIERVKHHLELKAGLEHDPEPLESDKRYIVQAGDTLYKIARKHGISLLRILAANPQITDPNTIQINDVINIPGAFADDFDENDVDIMARTIYGEARGESETGKIAVGWVIRNRVAANTWYGKTIEDVCLKPFQFSCWNPGEPSRVKLTSVARTDRVFVKCVDAAIKVISSEVPDPTEGATHYYANYIRAPAWTRGATFTVRIGVHLFYKNVG